MKKEQWLTKLETVLSDALSDMIKVPFQVICSYHNKILSVTLINLESGKSYLIAAIRGNKNDEGHAYIELFYVMPHFQGFGIGHTLLEYYAQLQLLEGEEEIHLKPIPFLPESRNPMEYFRLYTWLGKKDHTKMSRYQLIRFYKSAGFEPIYPNDLGSEMQKILPVTA